MSFLCLVAGCSQGPVNVAEFFMESALKENDENARSCVVSSKAGKIDPEDYVVMPPIAGIKEGEELPVTIVHLRRAMANHLKFRVVKQSETKAFVSYHYDVDSLREELKSAGFKDDTFIEMALLENFFHELTKVEEEFNLILEHGEWKIDP